ncbi:hypothetical protein [Desulfovibrio intestinalis]|uniref:Uncharacterized protein n=1 Tax=Desulfovibrio intestinalis TaxID=58621 RepID=A0A7W8C3E8_9BACT|nr:hypothetical protein [Desulfovibrio intestinalis]MBB5144118.1 hypothetical protein [Desulfovibrio intestinalis]
MKFLKRITCGSGTDPNGKKRACGAFWHMVLDFAAERAYEYPLISMGLTPEGIMAHKKIERKKELDRRRQRRAQRLKQRVREAKAAAKA